LCRRLEDAVWQAKQSAVAWPHRSTMAARTLGRATFAWAPAEQDAHPDMHRVWDPRQPALVCVRLDLRLALARRVFRSHSFLLALPAACACGNDALLLAMLAWPLFRARGAPDR
jgi:hypothetical protein